MSQCKTKMGSGGTCLCVNCGFTAPHQPSLPCKEMKCPHCGKSLFREGGEHHQLYLKQQQKKGIIQ